MSKRQKFEWKFNSKMRYWIIGTLTALAGVAVVKLIAVEYAGDTKIWLTFVGYTLAIFGLFYITIGTREKKNAQTKTEEENIDQE